MSPGKDERTVLRGEFARTGKVFGFADDAHNLLRLP